MNLSWKIGSLFGIPVKLHVSMLLVPLFILTWSDFAPAMGLGLVFLLFGSILLHELGHALVARRFGIHTQDIILMPLGGMARIVAMPSNPKHEIAIAVAGPIVSLVLSGLGWLAIVASLLVGAYRPDTVPVLLYYFFAANGVLALFNLIPALPMDGGRILRGLLALRGDYLKATIRAARIGRFLAVVGGVIGFLSGNYMLVFVCVFVFFSAGAEVRMATLRDMHRRKAAAFGFGFPFDRPAPSPHPHDPVPPIREEAPRDGWVSPNRVKNRNAVVIDGGTARIVSRKPQAPSED